MPRFKVEKKAPESKVGPLSGISGTRRQVFTAAGAALIVSALPPELARAALPDDFPRDRIPPTDGFFFIIPGKQSNGHADEDNDRIFFISSSWLPFFELTDTLTQVSAVSKVEITIGNPAKIKWKGHGLGYNDEIKFATTGTLPTPLTPDTTYYVKNASSHEFQISATAGGPSIATSGSQSGNHTALRSDPLGGKKKIAKKLKLKSDAVKEKWHVLYSDDLKEYMVQNPSKAEFEPLPPPHDGKTYLAMSISPSM